MIEIYDITEAEKYMQDISAAIFDLDDTLYSEKEYVKSGYKAVAEVLAQVEDVREKLWRAFEAGQPPIDTVLKEEGVYTEELKEQCLCIYRHHCPDIHLYAGVLEMLNRIRKDGIKIGIITDGRPEGQRAKIKALGLECIVDKIIITDELGGVEYRKPCERAFVEMRDCFDVEYKGMCYVGDNVKKDFAAPQKLGIRAIWFRNRDGIY